MKINVLLATALMLTLSSGTPPIFASQQSSNLRTELRVAVDNQDWFAAAQIVNTLILQGGDIDEVRQLIEYRANLLDLMANTRSDAISELNRQYASEVIRQREEYTRVLIERYQQVQIDAARADMLVQVRGQINLQSSEDIRDMLQPLNEQAAYDAFISSLPNFEQALQDIRVKLAEVEAAFEIVQRRTERRDCIMECVMAYRAAEVQIGHLRNYERSFELLVLKSSVSGR
jgi:hypothetical protein